MSFIERYIGKNPFNGELKNKITEDDITAFIERGIEESINLDYKQIEKYSDTDDLSNKIASFANSDGGLIILGISEKSIGSGSNKKILPNEITWGKEEYKKEDLDNRLFSKIKPWINDLRICAVRKKGEINKEIYLIDIPRSKNIPHWSAGGFYKRKNFSCEPMSFDEVKSAFLSTHIYRDKIIELIIIPLYSDINNILNKFDYANEIYTSTFNDINAKYRYYLDTMDNKILSNKIDAFYKCVEERNKYLSNSFTVARRIITEAIEDYQLKINPKNYAKPGTLEMTASIKRIVGTDIQIIVPLERVLIHGGDFNKYFSDTIADYSQFLIVSSIVKIPGRPDRQLNLIEISLMMKECIEKMNHESCFKMLQVLTRKMLDEGKSLKIEIGAVY